MTSKNYLIYAGFLVGLLGFCALLWYSTSMTIQNQNDKPLPDPLDVLFDFYDGWLDEAQANGSVKTETILLSSTALDSGLRDRIISGLNDGDASDPVLCQVATPDKIKVQYVSELPTAVEAIVLSEFASSTPTGYAVVKMSVVERSWVITDITCSRGDVLDDREFSFEQTGQLLKNVPAPLDSNFWHIVYSDNGTPGYTAPLFLSASSTCVADNGAESVCDSNTFTEAADVKVQGTMTETGVNVARIMFTAAQ
ncbi:MAG: hypothetical protein MUF19_01060 [Candidatus Pacebacteria bacterium]|jgi:hypothetical protein|nr:hypothetical protein [Candidatus Paceibacterota bacterium]